jgi:hypothetical protein
MLVVTTTTSDKKEKNASLITQAIKRKVITRRQMSLS